MKSQHRADQRSGPASEARVITIGWQVVVLPVLLLAVVGGGYMVGRRAAQRGAAAVPTAAPAGVSTPVGGMPDQATLAAMATEAAAAADPRNRYDPNTVYDLPRLAHPLLGKPAPDFTVTDFATGTAVSLSDFKGHPVLLDFWATWCGPCRYEMPWMESVQQKYADAGLEVLGFNVGEKVAPSMVQQQIQQFVDQYGLTFTVLVGEQNFEVQQAWSVAGYPSAFLIDKDGVVVDYHRGMFPNQVTLESRLAAILPGGQDSS
jgi:thiol-disulfide isomerase/thioredoxin